MTDTKRNRVQAICEVAGVSEIDDFKGNVDISTRDLQEAAVRCFARLEQVINIQHINPLEFVNQFAVFFRIGHSTLDLHDVITVGDVILVQDSQHCGHIGGHGIHQSAVKIK